MNKDIIEKAIKEAREKGRGRIISRDDIYNAIFKAGYDEGIKDKADFGLSVNEAAILVGRKEVVEWIEPFIETIDDPKFNKDWQAQKKIWLK